MLLGFPIEDFDRIEVCLFDGASLRFLALAHPDLTTLPPGSTLYVREMQEGEQVEGCLVVSWLLTSPGKWSLRSTSMTISTWILRARSESHLQPVSGHLADLRLTIACSTHR